MEGVTSAWIAFSSPQVCRLFLNKTNLHLLVLDWSIWTYFTSIYKVLKLVFSCQKKKKKLVFCRNIFFFREQNALTRSFLLYEFVSGFLKIFTFCLSEKADTEVFPQIQSWTLEATI